MIYDDSTMYYELNSYRDAETRLSSENEEIDSTARRYMNYVLKVNSVYKFLPVSEVYAESRLGVLENKDKSQIEIRRAVNRKIYRLARNHGFNMNRRKGENDSRGIFQRNANIAGSYEIQDYNSITISEEVDSPERIYLEQIIYYCEDHTLAETISRFNLPDTCEIEDYLSRCIHKHGIKEFKKNGRPKGLSKRSKKKSIRAEQLYLEGKLSVKKISKKLSISISTLYKYLAYRGVDLEEVKRTRGRKGGRKKGLSKEAKKKAKQAQSLYEKGAYANDICQRLHISNSTLYKYLKHQGVKFFSKERVKRGGRPEGLSENSQKMAKQAKELYQKDILISDICKELNMSSSTLYKYIRHEKVKVNRVGAFVR